MKGPWKVTSNPINGETKYAVCRVLDVDAVDHSGNREFATEYMEDHDEAELIAQALNDEEAETAK